MLIDSHTHIFATDSDTYPWDRSALVLPDYSAPIENLIAAMDSAQVKKAVLIQHSCYAYDNRYILDCVQRFPQRLCAVVKVDPLGTEAAREFEHLVQQHNARGLRLQPLSNPDLAWLSDETTFPLWEVARGHELVIGILLAPHQLPQAKVVIRQFPEIPVIIDHMGRLDVTSAPEEEAFQQLLNLRDFDNVYIKLSGFYALSHQSYPYNDLKPYVDAIYKAFGYSRLLWASDFPLLIHAGETYQQATRILEYHLPKIPTSESDWILGKTARALFKL